jgi:hypothetical protein
LHAQPRLLDQLAVLFLRGLAFGTPEGFGHPDEIVTLRLCDQPGESQQLAALFLAETREMRAIPFDGPKNLHACMQVII